MSAVSSHAHQTHDADRRERPAVRVRLVADPVSVPAARRFVSDALSSWQLPELVEDASLCVSELTSNAALHSGSAFFDVVMDEQPGAVCISVDDQGVVPAAAVVERDGLDDLDGLDGLSSTGRGLLIVSAIASDWGVEETGAGKRVWAQLSRPGVEPQRGHAEAQHHHPAPVPAVPPTLPSGWHVVRLAGCPVELSLRQDRHLDELVRELQIVGARGAEPSRELAEVIDGLLQEQAHARHMGRQIALDAAAAGLTEVDVDMPVPAEAAGDVQRLHQAVMRADVLCEQEQLLTLASSPDVIRLREWMVHEFVRQVEYGDPPQSYAHWLRATRA
ncbi:MAG: ATP-binding protein [Actinomycetota bacterium]|nr:ATP-binding protein [Actinomycetota bacterium]